MSRTSPVKLEFRAHASGSVNGKTIVVSGSGVIDEATGITIGTYDISALPPEFSPGLLTACLLTGYPNATQTPPGLVNPFQGRSYDYRRDLRFGSGEIFSYGTDCRVGGGVLESWFHLQGDAPSTTLPDDFIQEIEEAWTSAPTGDLAGRFRAAWTDAQGASVEALACSAYAVSAGPSPPKLRRLRLKASTRGGEFRLRQDSKLII